MNYLKQKRGFLGYEADLKIENKVVVVPFGFVLLVSDLVCLEHLLLFLCCQVDQVCYCFCL